METRETILTELQEISTVVAAAGSNNVFAVPQGYFEGLADAILAKIRGEELDLGTRQAPFSLPAGYFDSLADNILNKVKGSEQSVADELNELAPLLNTISKQPVSAVPEGYFESLEVTVPLKLVKPSARVFSFGKTRRMMQYAVAASTVGILALGVFLFNNNNTNDEMPISYKEAVQMNVTQEVNELTEADITSYLEETPNIGYAVNVAPEEFSLDEYLESTTDEEINQYLNESAETGTTSDPGS